MTTDPSIKLVPKSSWFQAILIGRRPRYTLVRLVVLVVVTFIVFRFILLPIQVDGISMLPTYRDGSINLVNRLAYWHHEPLRGDVVSVRLAGNHVMYMKRIIGQPGETVEFKKGQVLINGDPLVEPYEKNASNWDVPLVKLEADEYYVVGDNRTMPAADHVFGIVKRDHIIGKVML